MRKLASIQRVVKITPINADNIEVARVLGWNVVVKKDEFIQEGELVIYFEIDSFLPVKPEFEFLRKSCYRNTEENGEGFRLKTIKLRGVISQGLIMPCCILPNDIELKEGLDVTDVLGVKLYEPPMPACIDGLVRGPFPSLIRKTDLTRIQSIYNDIMAIQNDVVSVWDIEEKLDGSSMTCYYHGGDYGVCSRNLSLNISEDNIPKNTMTKVAFESGLMDALQKTGLDIAVNGELIGPGIQKNPYKLSKHSFRVFDIFLIDEQRYVTYQERQRLIFALERAGAIIEQVPYIGNVYNIPDIDDLVKSADGRSLVNPKFPREGIVYKSQFLLNCDVVRFKVISNKYLINQD